MFSKLPKIWGFRFFLNSRSTGKLILKCLLLLVIPYAYLMLCGFIFDKTLHWYFLTNFIFVSLVILAVAALTLIVWAVIRHIKRKKAGGAVGTEREKEAVHEHAGRV